MTNLVSALTARTQFGQILKRASQKNERFIVGKRGEPKVIIMGIRDYVDTIAPAPAFLKEIQTEAKQKGLDKLSMREIDAVIADVRRERRQKKAKSPR